MNRKFSIRALAVPAVLLLAPITFAQAPSDPQIAGFVQTANQIDISHTRLALATSNNSQVKDFANQMIADHTSFERSVNDLAKKASGNTRG